MRDPEVIEIFTKGGVVRGPFVLVHGGAGSVPEASRAAHAEGARKAARAGAWMFAEGGTALHAVEIAVRALEDDPLFNAGTGACLNEAGIIEHDASIMEGATLRAGAVAALRGFANPVAVARAALEDGRHVMYAADGARAFAEAKGFVRVDEARLVTEAARAALARAKERDDAMGWAGGTVGAVAIDAEGHVAAATSTGGTVNKRVGRVGDSPIVGAGTYADDESGAVSTTGNGEAMIRLVVAKSICDRLRDGAPPEAAARALVARVQEKLAATGGVIVVSKSGAWGIARSTATMSFAICGPSIDEHGV